MADEPGLLNRGYSYWAQAFIRTGAAFVFNGHHDGYIRFWKVDLATGAVEYLGTPMPFTGTGEGWTWDARGRILLTDGPRLWRVDPFNPGDDEILLDISSTHPGCRLWQAHSSDDGRAHSATIERITESGPYERIGVIIRTDHGEMRFFRVARLDEAQISKSGQFAIAKQKQGENGVNNYIYDLERGTENFIADDAGALGHSDMGPDFIIGADRFLGACAMADLADPRGARTRLFDTWAPFVVSVRGGRCISADRIGIYRVPLDGTGPLTLTRHGMVGDGYEYQVNANLDPTGRIACYVTNEGAGGFKVKLVAV